MTRGWLKGRAGAARQEKSRMNIAEMFRKSPFEPLRHHMTKVKECVALVVPMFECVRDGDHTKLEDLARRVFKAEHEADQIKNEIRRTIPSTFFLPVYRGDLLGYLKLQDDMADAVEDLAVLLMIKKLHLHEALREDALNLARMVVSVCEILYQATDVLKRMAENGGFEGGEVDELFALVAQAEHREWECDKAEFVLARKLFALDDEMKATDILLWSRVFMELGALANYAEKTGDRVRRMLTK
jgi:predicted phosphate transport protein (TIGR00153 family)